MKTLALILSVMMVGCATVSTHPLVPTPPIVALKQSSANIVIAPPQLVPMTMFWPDENDVNMWVVVESVSPYAPFVPYAVTSRPFVIIPKTNNQDFFNYCRAQDYNP